MVERPLFKFGKAIFGVVFTTIITSVDPRISSKRNRMQFTLEKEHFLTWAMILVHRYFYNKNHDETIYFTILLFYNLSLCTV
jgi:hypothetical protein